jgi:hypothetical protein
MKMIKFLVVVIFLVTWNATAKAQHNHGGGGSPSNMNMNMNTSSPVALPPRTESLKVWGKCGMCKERIEKIALASGAEAADWDAKAKFLVVLYNPGSSSIAYISDKLAKAGHDTGLRSAKDKAYSKLPECCQYERVR